jgi:hypothetical protein
MIKRLAQVALAGAALLVASTQARATGNPFYVSGRVMSTTLIIPIYYGNSWSSADINSTQAYLQDLASYMSGGKNPAGKQSAYAEYGIWGSGTASATTVADSNPRILQAPPGDPEIPNIIHAFQAQHSMTYNTISIFLLLPGPGYDIATYGQCGFRTSEGDGKYYAVVGRGCETFNRSISLNTLATAIDPNFDGWIGVIDPCLGHVKNFGTGDIALPFDNLTGACSVDGFDDKAGEVLHALVALAGGGLVHSRRRSDNTWTGFGDVKGQIGNPGPVTDVDSQGTTHGIFNHVVGVASGKLFHTIRTEDGRWTHYDDVSVPTHSTGTTFARVGLAEVNGDLHVCATTSTGGVQHAIRYQDGSWTDFADVLVQTGSPGSVNDVDCVGFGQDLQVVMSTNAGGLFHAIRHPTSWTGIGDVQAAAGSIGHVQTVTAAQFGNDLQVTVRVFSGNKQFNTIRHTSDGSWTAPAQVPNISVFDNASVGGTTALHLITSDITGVVQYRNRDVFQNWGSLDNVYTKAGGSPGTAVAVGASVSLGF